MRRRLSSRTGGSESISRVLKNAEEVVTMVSIDTVLAVITLDMTAVGFGLQLASYINTKTDRHTSSQG